MKRLILLPLLLATSACVGGLHPMANQSYLLREDAEVKRFANPKLFKNLPELDGQPIPIALYAFTDRTGQRKPYLPLQVSPLRSLKVQMHMLLRPYKMLVMVNGSRQ